MNQANETFGDELDQLIRLFKKIRANTDKEQFAYVDPAFFQNLDFIIRNYEMMKTNIPKEVLNQMGGPFQKILKEFIDQLKNELGEDEPLTEVKQEIVNDINEIDKLLRNPEMSENSIDELLDKRSELLKNNKNKDLPILD